MNDILSHLVGDYIVQTDWMASEKTTRSVPALVHAATYTACFLPLTRSPKALVVIGSTHFAIDRWRLAKHLCWFKNQLAPKAFRPEHTATGYSEEKPDWMTVWLMIISDNTVHIAINKWALSRWA